MRKDRTGYILAFIMTVIIIIVTYSMYMIEQRADKVYKSGEPKRIEACKKYGETFERDTKYTKEYGCLEKSGGEWRKVK